MKETMILSGKEILKEMANGNIAIDPFDDQQINPNSYNLRLHNKLMIYQDSVFDMKKKHAMETLTIPENGLLLKPGQLYLGRTFEYTETHRYVPMLEGRSSVGRLGLCVHVTAGFGDVGFAGFWTLEIHCVQPIRIYSFVEICQIYYHTIQGEYDEYCDGKYQNNTDIQPSMLYKDFL
ncbi:MAG: dCTP deaminase [Planctomycetaceae bacterium]|jgi:dCTP deaminase|nr:dCTP deaminase [Planctomycetaceae bacterium]